jgi:hypothetical protein
MTTQAKILHNHIGYELNGPKHAVILGKAADQWQSFRVLNEATGAEVFSGTPKATGTVDRWRDWHFWTLDFDALQTAGSYILEATGSQGTLRSHPFLIGAELLTEKTANDVLWYFKAQRCTGLLDKADRHLPLDGDNSGKTFDLHGGWYDATGDYGKHLSHLDFSTYHNPQQIPLVVWSLFKSYEAIKSKDNHNYRRLVHWLLDEALYGADYLTRSQVLDGSFFITVSGHGEDKRPEDRRVGRVMRGFDPGSMERTNPTQIDGGYPIREYQTSYRTGAGVSIAALAIASTYNVSGDFENIDYLRAAEAAFAWLEAHNVEMVNDGKENIVDDYCALLAATELYKATKRDSYKVAADKRAQSLVNRLMTDGTVPNYWRANDTDRPFFHAADGGLPAVSLFYYLEIASGEMAQTVREALKKSLSFELAVTNEVNNPFGYSRQYVQSKTGEKRTTFFYPHDADTAPWWQGENARLASVVTAAELGAKLFADDKDFAAKLRTFAANQLNWILGMNPFDMCMLDGAGRNNPPYQAYNGSEQFVNCGGGICNGITGGVEDEHDIAFHTVQSLPSITDNWRWGEQWLPHAAWYLLAVSII